MRSPILALTAAFLATGVFAGPAPAAVPATTTEVQGVEQPSSAPILMQPVVQGCFSSPGDLVFNSNNTFNSIGKCGQEICQALGKNVAATSLGKECYCGDSYPANSTLVADKFCNAPCTGYGKQACGGFGYWTVYNTGLQLYDIPYANSSSTSTSTSSSSTSVTTKANGETVFVTQTGTAVPAPKKNNVAGIAAGVVVGVVVVAAAVGGVFFLLRRRRNREIEEEHRRTAAVNSFFNGKPPTSSGGLSGTDARLDPVMAQRRLSDGSIADNEDYSRRILRVTNA